MNISSKNITKGIGTLFLAGLFLFSASVAPAQASNCPQNNNCGPKPTCQDNIKNLSQLLQTMYPNFNFNCGNFCPPSCPTPPGNQPGIGNPPAPPCINQPVPPIGNIPIGPDNGDHNNDNNNPPTEDKPDNNVSVHKYAQQVIDLVNKERAAQGLSPLTTNVTLQKAAQVRAEEIKKSFAHTRPDGSNCFTVLKDYQISYTGAGENIAAGQTTPAQVMQDWMNSPGHKANILTPSFTQIGVGVYQDANGKYHWSQLFIQ